MNDTMMTRTDRMNQFNLIRWAFRLEIPGRSDAVAARRLVLMFLICNATPDTWKPEESRLELRFNSKQELANEVGLSERRLYRALSWLIEAGLVERCKWSVRRLYLHAPDSNNGN